MENQYSEIKLEIEEFLAEIENNKDLEKILDKYFKDFFIIHQLKKQL